MASQELARRPLKSRQQAWATALSSGLSAKRVHPNSISVGSIVFSAIGAAGMLSGSVLGFLAAAFCIQLRLLCNLLDGMVAIEGGMRSASGEIYNDLPDRISDGILLVAAGYAAPWPIFGPALGWSATLLAIMTAYVRLLGGSSGLSQDFCGPMAKPHRMAVLTVACVLATFEKHALGIGLCIIALGSLATIVRRTLRIVHRLESN